MRKRTADTERDRPMWTRQLGALLIKDFQLHGLATALTIVGLILLAAILDATLGSAAGPRQIFIINLNLLFSLFLWAEWLITRECSKGTFAWLRTMPVDDRVLVGSKFIGAAAACTLCWFLSSSVMSPELWHSPATGLILQCALLMAVTLSVAAKWRFGSRLGQVAGASVIGIPVLLVYWFVGDDVERQAALIAVWNAPYGRLAIAASLLVVCAAIVLSTMRWVSRSDTYRLID